MPLEISLILHPHLPSFHHSLAISLHCSTVYCSAAPSLRYMGGALLRAALLQGPERAERRAVPAEQRVESGERRAKSTELKAKSTEYRAEVRRHRAKRGATER